MDDKLDLEEIFEVFRNHFKMILGLTLLGGIVATLITFFLVTPKYQMNTQVLVSQSEEAKTITNMDIQASLQLVNTYSDIIKSPTVLDEVVDNLDLPYSAAELSEKLKVSSENQSQVLNISLRDEDPKLAERIVNEVATVFKNKIPKIMKVDNVSILAKAQSSENPEPVSPQPIVNLLGGLIMGAIIGLALAFLRAFFDKRITTDEEVQKYLNIPVMGEVAEFK